MTGIPDEQVEKAVAVVTNTISRAMQCGDQYGQENQLAEELTASARAALDAVGLPALLERVEAAEREVVMALRMHDVQYERANRIEAERDALAAKVAELESAAVSRYSTEAAYAQLDREHPTWRTRAASDETSPNLRDWLSAIVRPRLSAADLTQADAAAFIGTSEKHLSQILNGRADASIAMWQRLLDFVNADLRAALTEGTEG